MVKFGYRDETAEASLLFEAKRTSLGPTTPETLAAGINLAKLLSADGSLAEAESLYRRTIEEMRQALGADHPDTLDLMLDLAKLLHNQQSVQSGSSTPTSCPSSPRFGSPN